MKYSKELHEKLRAGYCGINYVQCLLDEIDRLNAERRWIPVSEPPKVKGEYICYSKPDIFTCFFGDSWDGGLAFRSVIQPTHWMPLPEPPEEK